MRMVAITDSISALCGAKGKGQTRHIGVGNFTTAMLDEAVKLASEPLVTNQIEVHPFLDQGKVLAACRKYGLSVTAYCPLARAKAPCHEVRQRIGKAPPKSSSQTALRYPPRHSIIPNPRTTQPAN